MYRSNLDRWLPYLSEIVASSISLVAVLSLLVCSGCVSVMPKPPSATDEVTLPLTQTAAASLRAGAEATIVAARSTIEASQATSTLEPTREPTPTPPPTPTATPTPTPTALLVSPWSMYRHDAQRSGATACEGPEVPELKWTFQAGGRLSAPIIAADGTIYVDSEDGNLHAIEPSGGEKWAYALPGEVTASPALAADGTIYVARDKNLHALRPDGTVKWTYSGDHKIYDLTVGPDGTIYIGSECLHALSPDGVCKWVTSSETCQGFYSLAIAHDGTVYGLTGLDVYAFSLDGALKWDEWTAPGVRGFNTSITVSPQGDIYVNGTAAAGAQVALPIGPLDVLNPGGSFKFDRFRGEGFDGYIDSPPAIAQDGTVYVTWREVGESFITEEGVLTAKVGPLQLQARSPDATTIWSYPLGGNLCSYPVVGGDETVYVILCNGDLCALDASGNLRWRFNIGEAREGGYWGAWDLAIGADTIYVSSGNKLYAIGEGAPTAPLPTATPTPTPMPSVGGRIAFASNRNGNYEIYVMNADGSGVRRLAEGMDPVWSPDGRRIASTCGRGNREVCVMNADGSKVMNLTNNPTDDAFPAWSPDSQRIAFISSRDGNVEIYVINADGSGLTNLTNHPANDVWHTWSPDGRRIAFYSNRRGDGLQRIYIVNADGSGLVDLANNPIGTEPAWSPDGQRIAFADPFQSDNWEIYVMNADGSGVTNLTNNPAFDALAVWSPDGRRIAFTSDREDTTGIYVMNADGSGVTSLTTTLGSISAYVWSWSPDSQRIAFESGHGNPPRDCEIYVVNADGSGLTNLSNHPADDRSPAWSPVPVVTISPPSPIPAGPPAATVRPPAPTPTPQPLNPPPKCPDPNARITSPRMGDWISGVVPFKGSANVPDFQYYRFEYRLAGEEEWRFLVRLDQPVAKGTLMEWHTHTVPRGEYELRLTVIDRSGNYHEPCVVKVRVY